MKKESSPSPLETKAAFARRLGVNKSTITRWAKAGRLVLNVDGKVLVKESMARIKATEGHRSDLKQKHALHRGHGLKVAEIASDLRNEVDDEDMQVTEAEIGKDRAYYKAITLDMKNRLLKLEQALKEGERVEKSSVQAQLAQIGKQLKQGVERTIDNLAPQLVKSNNRAEKIAAEIKQIQP